MDWQTDPARFVTCPLVDLVHGAVSVLDDLYRGDQGRKSRLVVCHLLDHEHFCRERQITLSAILLDRQAAARHSLTEEMRIPYRSSKWKESRSGRFAASWKSGTRRAARTMR
jgi:hypothetical protein